MPFEAAPLEMKVEVLRRLAAGESVTAICKALGISRNSVYRWKHDAAAQAAAGVTFAKAAPAWIEGERPKEAAPAKPLRSTSSRGRPSPIEDEDLRERFLEACALGVSPKHLADLLGVTPSTIKNWLKGAEKGEGPAADWGKQILQASAEGVTRLHEKIHQGDPTWKAAAWLLSHRWPDIYSERREIISSSSDPTDDLSDEELQAIAEEEA
ncbi:helix-turn-helix domain-containing protein [Myxococcota bacterium]|nr:helix-turn-helix domain-containing protein [Myxococcota bacterium]